MESNNAATVISTTRLTKAFGNLVAVNDLNLQVAQGDVFGFLGPNGSGKTTTIRMLLGLIRPSAGRAAIFGMDNAYQLPHILPRIGAIVETPVFYPYLSGLDNLRIMAANSGMVQGKANNRRLEEVLELVELRAYEKMAYRKYSLGMKQRLGIAAALLNDPELVMLDEPTNGLDPAGMIEIRRLIIQLSALGKTVFLSSHLLAEVQQVCNRVAILRRGNLVKQGNVKELLRTYEQIEVRMADSQEHQQALDFLRSLRERGVDWLTRIVSEQNQQKQTIILLDAPVERSTEVNKLLAQQNLFAAAIHPREGSLEEVFIELTTPNEIGGAYAYQGGALPASPAPVPAMPQTGLSDEKGDAR